MEPRSQWGPLSNLVKGKRPLIGAVVIALTAAIVVPLSLRDDRPTRAADIFHAEGCNSAPAIDAPPQAKSEGAWAKLALPKLEPCATLAPTDADGAGVALTSSFVLAATEEISVESVTERLQTEPKTAFTVKQETATQLKLTPKSPLTPGAVYRVALLDAPDGRPVTRWAFQTKSPLRVVQTLPANASTDAPLNVGIELTFSHDNVTGVEERFTISPKTEGRFETHKRVVVFVPRELRKGTLYTVTLKPGVGIEGSKEKTTEPYTFRFETGHGERDGSTPGEPAFQFSRAVWESATKEAPVVSMFYGRSGKLPGSLPFTVYRFDDVDDFLASLGRFTSIPSWAMLSRQEFVASTKGLDKAITFNGRLQRLGEGGDIYVRFPDALRAGFYLVTTEYKGAKVQTWLQVTDIATYAAVSSERTLVWTNDLATKGALKGATVKLAGGARAGTTDANGVSAFPTPDGMIKLVASEYGENAEVVRDLIVTATDGRLAVVPLADIFTGFHTFDFREYTFSGDPSPYWRFLYADRDLYRLTDTIRFWGLARKRVAPERQNITIELIGGYNDFNAGPVVLARKNVKSTQMGTFIGELSFAGVAPGYYELQARIGQQTIASTSVQIEDFTKPAYKIDVTTSKKAILSGERVRYDVAASFFEGSPVPQLALKYGAEEDPTGRLVTNDAGKASVARRPKVEFIQPDTLSVFPELAEEGEISGQASVQVFPSTVALREVTTFLKGRVRVDGVVFNVDFAGLNAPNADPYDYEGSPAGGRRVTARVTEISWRRVETGDSYDFINKIVTKHYRYEEVRRSKGTYSDVSDSRGRFTIAFDGNENRSYEIDLRVTDSGGRAYTTTDYAYSGYDIHAAFPYVAALTDDPYRIGDEVSVVMRSGVKDMPSGGDNRYLFFNAANGILNHAVSTKPTYTFTFAPEHIPNVETLAVRFNGVTYTDAGYGSSSYFDYESRRLTIDVQATKARYRPGETAQLSVRVTDARGRPVKAEVLLSAVDEALFRVHPESFFDRDILEALYDFIPSGVMRAYASHQFPEVFEGAEFGGEGAERVDFRDVGIFTTVTTGADGRASAPFKLPDNLTSWRITALAVTDSLYAGKAVALVPVGLPVFADLGLSDSYLVTDEPSARVRAFGSELKAGDPVTFKLETPTLSNKPATASGKAFEPVDIALPTLREGTHRVALTVSAKGRTDTIVRSITVVASRLLRIQASHDEIAAGESFVPPGSDDRLTTVVLSDHNRGRYYPALQDLTWTRGDRVDQMLARNISQQLLTKYFDEITPFPAVFTPTAYQSEEGGIAIFPFADDDLVLSARVAAIAADKFGRAELASYFSKVLGSSDETRERQIIALYGLAAIGEPVLSDVQRAAALKDLSVREKLFTGLAAAELGDEATAKRLYRELLEEFGEVRGALVRLNVGKDREDILEATSLASILAAWLGDDAAPAMFDYVSGTYSREILTSLEQISFLIEALPRLSGEPSTVSYTAFGKRETLELSEGSSVSLILTAAQRKALTLEVTQGRIGVATSYLAPFSPKEVKADPQATVTRTLDGESTGTLLLEDGDLVRIELVWSLGPKAFDGCYMIADVLPSGLRPVARPFERGIEEPVSYPYSVEGHRVSWCAYQSMTDRVIVYYARVIGTGTFTVEPATIQSLTGPELITLTRSMKVGIK